MGYAITMYLIEGLGYTLLFFVPISLGAIFWNRSALKNEDGSRNTAYLKMILSRVLFLSMFAAFLQCSGAI
jgi:hypothetical protein